MIRRGTEAGQVELIALNGYRILLGWSFESEALLGLLRVRLQRLWASGRS